MQARLARQKKRDTMTLHSIGARLALSAALLGVALAGLGTAAHLGAVDLGAGDMRIVFGRGESGLTMDIGARKCPPHCGVDINWRPLRG
jgi:hypothetical protein